MMDTYLVTLPILIPFAAAALGLLLRNKHTLQGLWSLGAALVSFAITGVLLWRVWQAGEAIVFQGGAWPAPFGISLVGDLLGAFMSFMAQLILVMGIIYALGSRDETIGYPTFYPLVLMMGVGLTGVMLTGDIFNMYVFIELLLVSGAVLTAISDNRSGPEAAYKYFYLSLLASWFLLFAIGSLYVEYGTLNMADLAARVAAEPNAPLLPVAIVLLFAAFMVKSAVFPFHFWQPDLYMAAPTAVAAILSAAVSKVGVYGFLRMTTLLFVEQADMIRTALIVFGILGILYGGFSAIGTKNAKRMLAYSSMAQIGFILVAIGWGTTGALVAALVFIFNHALIKSALMMLTGVVASHTENRSAAFRSVTGLGRSMPYAGGLFLLGGLALSGIPPTNGFFSKMLLFGSGIAAEEYVSLAIVGVASVLTLVYTTTAFMRIWWQAPEADKSASRLPDRILAPTLLIALVLALGIWAEPLIALAQATANWLGDPTLYISAVLGA